jgi:hypothetical protein
VKFFRNSRVGSHSMHIAAVGRADLRLTLEGLQQSHERLRIEAAVLKQ